MAPTHRRADSGRHAHRRADSGRHAHRRADSGRHAHRRARTTPAEFTPATRLPVARLVTMAAAGFVTMVTEALPVAVMPSMRESLGWSDGRVGQLVTAYAVGCCLAALPVTLLTRAVERRLLLLVTLAAFAITNVVTMLTSSFELMLVARFVAGACAGLVWAMLAGYATRLVQPHIAGRAMAVAMLGTPLALALGIPLGTWLGDHLGWRDAFLAVSAVAAALYFVGAALLPRVPGDTRPSGPGVLRVLAMPGESRILLVTCAFAVGHNLVYTFVPSLVADRRTAQLGDLMLAFGAGAVIGLAVVGRLVDSHLQPLARMTCTALAVVLVPLTLLPGARPQLAIGLVVVWGVVFGGAPTLFQTTSAKITDESRDIGQALVVTAWNGCVALAAMVGGILVDDGRLGLLPLAGAALALVARALLGGTYPGEKVVRRHATAQRAPQHARAR